MPAPRPRQSTWIVILISLLSSGSHAFFFSLDQAECLYYTVTNQTYIYTAYVVTKFDHYWTHEKEKFEVDLKVTDPKGSSMYSQDMRSEDKFFYYAFEPGDYKYCFTNRARVHVQMSMEILTNEQHIASNSESVKDHHVDSVQEALNTLNFEVQQAHHEVWYAFYLATQHINLEKSLNKRLFWKGALQALLLVACSVGQIFALRWLVEKRSRKSKV